MSFAIIAGSEASRFFAQQGLDVVGIDNDMRRVFFGEDPSTAWNRKRLETSLSNKYKHIDADIRDIEEIDNLITEILREIYEFNKERWEKEAV